MAEVPLRQTIPTTADNGRVYLPAVFSQGQKTSYFFTIPIITAELPDTVASKKDLANFVSNNNGIPTTGLPCTALFYDTSRMAGCFQYGMNITATNNGWVPVTNQQGTLMLDGSTSILATPSNGQNQRIEQDIVVPVSASGAVQVTFPTSFSAVTADMCFGVTVGASTSSGSSPFSASVIIGDSAHPIATNSCYLNIIGTPPSGSVVFLRVVGNK